MHAGSLVCSADCLHCAGSSVQSSVEEYSTTDMSSRRSTRRGPPQRLRVHRACIGGGAPPAAGRRSSDRVRRRRLAAHWSNGTSLDKPRETRTRLIYRLGQVCLQTQDMAFSFLGPAGWNTQKFVSEVRTQRPVGLKKHTAISKHLISPISVP
jgi:hypothetical protein